MSNVTTIAEGGSDSHGLTSDTASPTLNNVTATGRLAATLNIGVFNVDGATPIMNNTVASGVGPTGAGIWNNASSPVMDHVNAHGGDSVLNSFGIVNMLGSAAVIRNSVADGATASILNNPGTAVVTNSTLTGGGAVNAGFTCSQVGADPGPADANSTCT